VRQAAELLGLTPQRVNRLIAAGRLRVNRDLGIKVLDCAEVEQLRQARGVGGEEEPVRFTMRPHPVPALDLEAEILGNEAAEQDSLRQRFARLYRTLEGSP
jgi:hypothetical protein